MIRHILKLVWNRKRANFLLVLEMAISFLVLFGVAALGIYCYDGYRRPLGFAWEDVWNVSVVAPGPEGEWGPDKVETVRQLAIAVRGIPEVEQVTTVSAAPFSNSHDISSYDRPNGGAPFEFGVIVAGDAFDKIMKLRMIDGRWFSAEDDGANYHPKVINQRLARELFGTASPIGKPLAIAADGRPEERIVGVLQDFRKNGELSAPANFVISRADPQSPSAHASENLILRLRPGSPKSAEARIVAALQATGKGWSFEIRPLSEMRALANKVRLAPLLSAGMVAVFLILMVGLGLTGVLWQNVTQRIKEIGLRRAKGATARDIQTQILGELVVLASAGIVLGGVIAIQFPLLALVGPISTGIVLASLAASVVLLYGLTLLCGAYPSRMASRITPAEALHYE
jgi:putative ABC transport system permease protein